jgi:winged helix domain-containing protein/ATPase family protein associated with various cellular activities (AAA)
MPDPAPDDVARLMEDLARAHELVKDRLAHYRARRAPDRVRDQRDPLDFTDDEFRAWAFVPPVPVRPPSPRLPPRAAAPETRLEHLSQAYGLRPWEVDALLVALLPEIDPVYRRVFGVLMDDEGRLLPSVELIRQIIGPRAPGLAESREPFTGPLVRHQLLEVTGEGGATGLSNVQVDPRVVGYLLGSDAPDARLADVLSPPLAALEWDRLVLPDGMTEELQALAAGPSAGELVLLHGPYGSGRRTVAATVCKYASLPLIGIRVPAAIEAGFAEIVRLAYREATLRRAAVCWLEADPLLDPDAGTDWARLTAAAAAFAGLTFVVSQVPWEPSGADRGLTFSAYHLPVPSFAGRRRLWQAARADLRPELGGELDTEFANAFQFTGGQIADALAGAWALALVRDRARPVVTRDDAFEGARRQSSRRLVSFARRVRPQPELTFGDLALPPSSRRQLDELRTRIRFNHQVFDELGFSRRTQGRGIVAMFTGLSGTGKTFAAQLLAQERGSDLYVVDLAAVVSKYVGETEKNLDRVFREAEQANAMLFFDEADALFAKRGEVRDPRDRYANVEGAFLLQRLEEHNGIVILATNLRQNIDEAFLRRLHAHVEFPAPDQPNRLKIWLGLFPAGLPRPDDMVIADLATRFPMPGGSIRNSVLDAAFRALDRGEPVGIQARDLVLGIARELDKLQLPIHAQQFGDEYYEWVREELADGPRS